MCEVLEVEDEDDVMFEKAVPCDGRSCRDRGQFHTHHLTRWGVFWWRTFRWHRGKLVGH